MNPRSTVRESVEGLRDVNESKKGDGKGEKRHCQKYKFTVSEVP